ncbi:MAG: hypothetical protein H0X37_21370 [Herpetosiphonaceae bacterium]|nr:hypothetical protein [Herpetosiphonaceae bacterium]
MHHPEATRQTKSATMVARIRAFDPRLMEEFGQYYEAKLAPAKAEAVRAGSLDPYEVQEQLLLRLLEQAYGRDRGGRCFVPEPGLESPGWRIRMPPPAVEVDPQGERAGRTTTRSRAGMLGSFATLGGGDVRRGVGIVALVSLLVLGPLFMYLTWPKSNASAKTLANAGTKTPQTTAAGAPALQTAQPVVAAGLLGTGGWTPSVAGLSIKADTIAPASLEFSDGIFRVDTTKLGPDGSWHPKLDAGHAAWLEGTVANLVVCVGPDAGPVVGRTQRGAAILIRSHSGSLRRYQVDAVATVPQKETAPLAQTRSGLTVILCGVGASAGSSDRQVLIASYRPDLPSSVSEGQPVALGKRAILTVEAARVVTPTVTGPGGTPPGQIEVAIEVAVTNLQPTPLPLDGLVDELQWGGQLADLADDSPRPTLAPAGQKGSAGRVIYRYRTVEPDMSAAGPAVWHLAGTGGERISVNIHVVQPVLVAAPQQLHAMVTAAHLMAAPGGARQLMLTIQFTNPGTTPTPIDWSAVSVWDGRTGAKLAPEDQTTHPDLVAPGATIDQLLTVAAPQGPMAVVDLGVANGGARWHLTLHSNQ